MILTNQDIKEIYKSNLLDIIPKIEGAYNRYYELGETESPYLGGLSYDDAQKWYYLLNKDVKKAILYQKATQFYKNMRKKKSRLKKKIELIIREYSYFLTLTFKSSVLESTNEETRKTYVKEFLKQYSNYYIANVDYGLENEREHYHAIIRAPQGTFLFKDDKSFPYGYLKALKISTSEADIERLSRYINKLANHSLKATNKSHCVIYSRFPKNEKLSDISRLK